MIDKQQLTSTVEEAIKDTDLFVVDIAVTPQNSITVEVDSSTAVDIDTCAAITRAIEAVFDRDVEDYELEVGSAGLTSPLKVPAQYRKNIGNDVEILTRDGRKIHGVLTDATDTHFSFKYQVKEKPQGAKRPVMVEKEETIPYADAKQVRYDLKF